MAVITAELPEEAQKALTLFPEFQIREFNDSGANGYILLGHHTVLKKDVAIKIYFHAESDVDQEPALIASINHENVIKVFDARKIEDGCSYFLMQSANDGDLFKFLKNYNISKYLSHSLLCQLLSGLSALHSAPNQIVHRDLKPENLLVHNDNLVIADFGSVRRIDVDSGKAPVSKHSILYRPPESFGKDAYYDFSSDIYQAGIIGFLLLGGKLSNDLLSHLTKGELKSLEKVRHDQGDYEISVFIDECLQKKICNGKLIDWQTLPFYISNSIKRILKKATSVKTRYSNSSEFLADLAKIKIKLPNWMPDGDAYKLIGWNGNDYIILCENETHIVKKKKSSTLDYRQDKTLKGHTKEEVFNKLKRKLQLP